MKYIILVSILMIVLFLFNAISTQVYKLKFYADPDLMEQEILRLIPVVSSISKTEIIMKLNWFKCKFYENHKFTRSRRILETSEFENEYFNRVDFLRCDRSKGFIVTQDWITAIIHEQGRVTEVIVNYCLTGL